MSLQVEEAKARIRDAIAKAASARANVDTVKVQNRERLKLAKEGAAEAEEVLDLLGSELGTLIRAGALASILEEPKAPEPEAEAEPSVWQRYGEHLVNGDFDEAPTD